MGLTSDSTGKGAVDSGLFLSRAENEYVVALAGNPNVGKSTIFNALTGMKQHTGNWAGKTVTNACGRCSHGDKNYILVDLPGTYSLMAHSAEEEVARDFVCFENPDAVIVVCDATCIERNLNLVLQTIEITPKTIVCVNLLDEAKKKNITIDLEALSHELSVPVVGVTARSGDGLSELMDALDKMVVKEIDFLKPVCYPPEIEKEAEALSQEISPLLGGKLSPFWTAVKLIDHDEKLCKGICQCAGCELKSRFVEGFTKEKISDEIISAIIKQGEEIAGRVTSFANEKYYERDRRIDRILTSRIFGIPIMLMMLAVVFWLTITAANYPSELLSRGLFFVGGKLEKLLIYANSPEWLTDMLINGIYRVLAWVVSVMLPPMAIFFPLFTLLEDSGYLPRVAFNLDKHFRRCGACGKQALTMCMGFGCNAAGITGCRIIDSPRERLIAILTNNFVPCNGRFPALISIIAMFFAVSKGVSGSIASSALLLLAVLAGIFMTFAVSWILSHTLLKGVPSSFTLELPPYRRPQIGKVIIRSIFDRTIFVLGRACAAAAPAGLLIWLLANINISDASLLSHLSQIFEPIGLFLGLDGVILLAFFLGFPANEIVIPIIIMAYTAQGKIVEVGDLSVMKEIFVSNGWSTLTALCMIIMILFHFPCSTACLTVKKETGSLKWTAAAILIPELCGIILCAAAACLWRLFTS